MAVSAGKEATKKAGINMPQIGIVVRNTEKALEYYEKTLGLAHFVSFVSERQTEKGKAKLRISIGEVAGIQIELIEVVEGETFHSQFLKQGREGLHHVGFYVDDIEKKLRELTQKGVKVLERGTLREVGVKYAYLDTARISGVIFELIQLP
nr:VOC family protein [Candidatus Njordarchaeum guaymaensis]